MAAVLKETMKIAKLKEHIGAEVTGVDLRQPLDEATKKRLNEAAAEHVALVIRDQHDFTPAQYQAAAENFGELMEDQNRRYIADGVPLVSILDNRFTDSKGGPAKVMKNGTWHTDHTNQERPPKFTMLYPVALPDKGGNTAVCNMRAAYEALPKAWKDRITNMKTENCLISSARYKHLQSGHPQGTTGREEAVHGRAARAHASGNRHEGDLVPQGQDRARDRHGAGGNAGVSSTSCCSRDQAGVHRTCTNTGSATC